MQSDVKNASLVVETVANDNNGSTKDLAVSTASDGEIVDSIDDKDGYVGVKAAPTTEGGTATNIKNGAAVTVSDGNTLTFDFSKDTYTITGSNQNDGTKTYTYDSSTGNITAE